MNMELNQTEETVAGSAKENNPGDGFTEAEGVTMAGWDSKNWHPPTDAEGKERIYEEVEGIGDLVPGLRGVRFMGRVRGLNVVWGRSEREKSARGWVYVVLGDEGGNVGIKLYFAQTPYPIQLGSLLSIWTAFISASPKSDRGSTISAGLAPGAGAGSNSAVSIYANMFPGRNRSDCVMIMGENEGSRGVCRTPMGGGSGGKGASGRGELNGLMTLESWKNGGWDGVPGARILVCVGSISGARTVKRKDKEGKEAGSVNVREVELLDHTGSVTWSIWGEDLNSSLECWKGKGAVLLFTDPVFKVGYRGRAGLSLGKDTLVDVEPDCEDARWLRRWLRGRERKRERVGMKVPEGVFEEAGWDGPRPALFKLADIDEWVRDEPHQTFTGFISVIILDVYLVQNYRRNMLMCTECCHKPQYTNSPSPTTHPSKTAPSCPHCQTPIPPSSFTLNPSILGLLVDETGSIQAKGMIWAPRAWEDVLGRNMHDVHLLGAEGCWELEERLRGMRGSFWVGWMGERDGDGEEGEGVGGVGKGGVGETREGKEGKDDPRGMEVEVGTGGRLCVLGMKM
ncbi:hypothetical protein ACMFMG_006200 [Clarireedia jacksonii]